MAHFFSESEVDPELIRSLNVGIVGYGNQGHAHALNLKDSGVTVRIGLHQGSKSRKIAEEDGFAVLEVAELARWADVLMFCTPDVPMADIYCEHVVDHLTPGKTLLFAHGFNVHYGRIKPQPHVNVAMVSPKGPGHALRRQYRQGGGLPALVAVFQDADGQGQPIALSYAAALGCFRSVVVKTTFREETEGDLFGEQAVLCGGISALLKAGFETLVEAGYAPEVAYFECVHEAKLITDLIYEGGFAKMHKAISDTAEWGDYVAGKQIITEQSRAGMRALLARIQDGSFAREWIEENERGLPRMKPIRDAEPSELVETVGAVLREQMPSIRRLNESDNG